MSDLSAFLNEQMNNPEFAQDIMLFSRKWMLSVL